MAIYYSEIINDDGDKISIEWPTPLRDIATRWRMFYFHHYMSVALEGMFAWLVTQVSERGIVGATTTDLSAGLNKATVRREFGEFLECKLSGKFGTTNPAEFFEKFGVPEAILNEATSRTLDKQIRTESPVAEHRPRRCNPQLHISTFADGFGGAVTPVGTYSSTLRMLGGIQLRQLARNSGQRPVPRFDSTCCIQRLDPALR